MSLLCLMMASQAALGMRNQRSLVNTFPFNAAETHQHQEHHNHGDHGDHGVHGDHGAHGDHGQDARAVVSNTLADRDAKQVRIKLCFLRV